MGTSKVVFMNMIFSSWWTLSYLPDFSKLNFPKLIYKTDMFDNCANCIKGLFFGVFK